MGFKHSQGRYIFVHKKPEAPLDGCLLGPTECGFVASSTSYINPDEGRVVIMQTLGPVNQKSYSYTGSREIVDRFEHEFVTG